MKKTLITLALLSSTVTACGSETDKAIANYVNSGKLDKLVSEYEKALASEQDSFAASRSLAFTQLCMLNDIVVTQSAYLDGSSFLVIETPAGSGGGPVVPNKDGDFYSEYEVDENESFIVQWKGGRESTPIYYGDSKNSKAVKRIGVEFSCTVTKPI